MQCDAYYKQEWGENKRFTAFHLHEQKFFMQFSLSFWNNYNYASVKIESSAEEINEMVRICRMIYGSFMKNKSL